ncbi:MAG TPA: hypothetical protein VFA79_10370 [Myxococcales bacterium]|nr:hypothetical protein [Myxococcales bacterium]
MGKDPAAMEFEVEASLLINEGGVHCTPVVFARPLRGAPDALPARPFLNDARVASLDPVRAAQRGPGLVAFVLEDPMDAREFRPGDKARLQSR